MSSSKYDPAPAQHLSLAAAPVVDQVREFQKTEDGAVVSPILTVAKYLVYLGLLAAGMRACL